MKIDYGKFAKEQGALLKKGNEPGQRKFLENFLDTDDKDFRKVFDGWGLDESPKFILPKESWEDEVFASHPFPDHLEDIIKMFAEVQPCDLSRPATWYAIHIQMVEKGAIDKFALAYGGKGEKAGRNSITQAIANEGKRDGCVRNILRHAGGILKDRGSRSAFLDCPTGSFYWKCRFCLDTTKTYEMDRRSVYDALNQSGVWETLVEGIVSKMTIVGDSKIRPALIAYIAEELEKNPGKKKVKNWAKDLRRKIGQLSLVRHLGFLEPQELLKTLKAELKN